MVEGYAASRGQGRCRMDRQCNASYARRVCSRLCTQTTVTHSHPRRASLPADTYLLWARSVGEYPMTLCANLAALGLQRLEPVPLRLQRHPSSSRPYGNHSCPGGRRLDLLHAWPHPIT